jgi:hypothetical protein
MTRKSRISSRYLVFVIAAVMALAVPWTVLADVVENNVVSGGNDTITVGGSTEITYQLRNTGPGDANYPDPNGPCNASSSNPVTVTISAPADVTLSGADLIGSNQIQFTGCIPEAKTVTFSSSTQGNYSITHSASGGTSGGAVYASPANFTLNVNAAPVTVTPPVLSLPADIQATATSSAGAVVNYSASASDEDGDVPIDCAPVSGSTFALGTTTVNCSAENVAGRTDGNFKVHVTYGYSGVLQPVNADGSSIFKLNSTVPVKFQLTGDSAGITDAQARIFVQKISNGVAGEEMEAVSTAAATTGNLFRYDAKDDQYIFNLGTRSLSAGTYQVRIDLGDGTTNTVTISLRK